MDAEGVLRWTGTGREVALFGVNYTTPFAYAYRAHGYMGADRRAAIDADVAHLARLGVDAYRVHVWDREISDREGNLLENDHLELLDYLLARLAERGIHAVLTPIFWGGTGYPERDPPTTGFSGAYGKGDMTVSPEARRAQQRYLAQFVLHVNRYTGRSYRDDPTVLALELFNEPSHPASPEERTRYIDDLARAVRDTGFRKPIFYNISIGWSDAHARAVCAAQIQGVTFQWYPGGLVRGGSIRSNLLPNVDRYPIPFLGHAECRDKARVVYEFDAADAPGSYLYPAMARSFRGAGMQWATQFAYDPLALAHVNTEYQTHYLNLAYTPRKAISFLIAGEAFRGLPRGAQAGRYPESARFGPFRVSAREDLSEMVTDEAFLNAGPTVSRPPRPDALRRVAGYGSSPVVRYPGRGAYFLDRLEPGVWRLEVYPDAMTVDDPFGRARLDREVTRLLWREHEMWVGLPDLGADYEMRAMGAGSARAARAARGTVRVVPGVYLLRRSGVEAGAWTDPSAPVGRLRLGEQHLPARREAPAAVWHRPPLEGAAGTPLVVRAEVASEHPGRRVELWSRRMGSGRFTRVEMRTTDGFTYQGSIPAGRAGGMEYAIRVVEGDGARSFPGGRTGGEPGDSAWRVPVAAAGAPLVLLDVARDGARLLYPHPYRYVRFRTEVVEGSTPERRALRAVVESFEPEPHHFAVRSSVGDDLEQRLGASRGHRVLRLRARSATGRAERIEVALVERDGTAWGAVVTLPSSGWADVAIPLASLRPVPLALLPRPYPEFLPNELAPDPGRVGSLRVEELEGVQLRIAAGHYGSADVGGPHGFEVERVTLEAVR